MQKLSIIPRQVVATGGGSVVRPINWYADHTDAQQSSLIIITIISFVLINSTKCFRKYMRQGITVFLDVPLDALARRIAAVGTDSRPLLHLDSGDPYTKVAFFWQF